MTKRAFSLILALIILITLLCGCSVERLSLDEYKSEIKAAVTEWLDALSDWSDFVGKYVIVNGEDMSFEEAQKNKGGLEQKLLKVEDALDKIDKIGNPPEEYDELHKKLKKGVSIEREWLKYQREMNNAKTEAEYSAAGDKVSELVDKTVNESLPHAYLELIHQFNSGEDGALDNTAN